MPKSTKRLLILIAGPYRSGTDDDPQRMAGNLRRLESYALAIYRAGHVPMIGEWVALPLIHLAGSQRVGDAAYEEIAHPVANRLLEWCDAVLRIGGASKGAEQDVRLAKERGLAVYYDVADVPLYAPPGG
jgi:hypothetical protein